MTQAEKFKTVESKAVESKADTAEGEQREWVTPTFEKFALNDALAGTNTFTPDDNISGSS